MSVDDVMVKPVRTFLEGSDLKHPESEPYRVSRSRMMELRGNGLVEHVGAGPEPEAPDALSAEDSQAATAVPRRRGRPPKPR